MAQAPVMARLTNVPLGTPVLLLADMAGLKSVEVDGVYYVTSRENARALCAEQAKARAARTEAPKPKTAPTPGPVESAPSAKDREERARRLKETIEGKPPSK